MSRLMTVEVLGVDLDVDFDGTPFKPRRLVGTEWYPAEGGEATINGVFIDGTEITDLLNEWVMTNINGQLVEFLCRQAVGEATYAEV